MHLEAELLLTQLSCPITTFCDARSLYSKRANHTLRAATGGPRQKRVHPGPVENTRSSGDALVLRAKVQNAVSVHEVWMQRGHDDICGTAALHTNFHDALAALFHEPATISTEVHVIFHRVGDDLTVILQEWLALAKS